MEDLLYKLNPWWEGEYSLDAISREKYLNLLVEQFNKKDIVILTGLRRVGKTTILKQTIVQLLKTTNPKNIFFVPLDALGFEELDINEIVDEYRKIHRLPINEKIYLFFDEVQQKNNFQHILKSMYDNENVKIYASGSSATILKDKKAYLTGRSRMIEVLPLDFGEYLTFKRLSPKKSETYLIEEYFKDYLTFGGMPEYVLTKDPVYISSLVNDVLYKDIIAKNNIGDKKSVKDLFRLLCERVGKPTTYSKLSNVLGVSVDTIKRYLSYFEDSFLVYIIDRFSHSLNERVQSPKKIYLGDVGIRNVTVGFKDVGAIYENLVFLKLKDHSPSYLYENGAEIDFVFKDTLVEAKYGRELNEKQTALMNLTKSKNKIVANGYKYLLE